MTTIAKIRVANLELLIKEAGTLEKVATLAESSSVYLSQVRNGAIDHGTGRPRELGTRMARRLEAAFKKDAGWLDTPHEPDEATEGRVIADALKSLSSSARRETLEFIRYKLERAQPQIANEQLAQYFTVIDRMERDAGNGNKSL